jgi:hypothetical protein
MRIAILVEGKTEVAFMPSLRNFLSSRLEHMPRLVPKPYNGRIPKKDKLRRVVENHLTIDNYDAVMALTDVYTGTKDFKDAEDAKKQMREWVGDNPKFYPHAAPYDFEAWLLPFWSTIQKRAKHNKSAPGGNPEQVNHDNPPSKRIKEIYELGKSPKSYDKAIEAPKILEQNNLMISIQACPELKAFINTILTLCESELIP